MMVISDEHNRMEKSKEEGIMKDSKTAIWKEVLDWALHIGAAVVIALLIVKFVAQVTKVEGISMMPTLQDGNKLVMEKLTNQFGTFKRGDIVVVEAKKELRENNLDENHSPLIKRIIGVEGDRVQVSSGSVYVNGEKLVEGYINGNYTYAENYPDYTVPKGHVYVMGDNRLKNMSVDSRMMGSFDTSRIIGRVFVRIFPLNEFGGL